MTRIFTDGAEFGDVLFFTDPAGVTASAVQKRTGSYSYRVDNTTGYKNVTAASSGYFREGVYWTWTGATSSNNYLVAFRNSTTVHVGIYFNNATTKFGVNAGGVSGVVESTHTFLNTTWYLLEVYVNIGGSGAVIVKIDGIEEINWSGDTQNGVTTTYDNIAWYDNVGSSQFFYSDDIAYNDTNGSVDNSWCNDGHIELLVANNNGDVNDWTGSDGDSVNNYLLVDDIPPNTTDYVKATTTIQDMYNVVDFTAADKIVTRIYSECRAMDNTSSGGAIKTGYKHGGTVYLSSAVSLLGSYTRIVGDEARLDPSDSTVWSDADLDSIQFVVENSSSSSTTSSSSSSTTTSSSSTVPP